MNISNITNEISIFFKDIGINLSAGDINILIYGILIIISIYFIKYAANKAIHLISFGIILIMIIYFSANNQNKEKIKDKLQIEKINKKINDFKNNDEKEGNFEKLNNNIISNKENINIDSLLNGKLELNKKEKIIKKEEGGVVISQEKLNYIINNKSDVYIRNIVQKIDKNVLSKMMDKLNEKTFNKLIRINEKKELSVSDIWEHDEDYKEKMTPEIMKEFKQMQNSLDKEIIIK